MKFLICRFACCHFYMLLFNIQITSGFSCYKCDTHPYSKVHYKACLTEDPITKGSCPPFTSGCVVYTTERGGTNAKGCAPGRAKICFPQIFQEVIRDGECVIKYEITANDWKSFADCIRERQDLSNKADNETEIEDGSSEDEHSNNTSEAGHRRRKRSFPKEWQQLNNVKIQNDYDWDEEFDWIFGHDRSTIRKKSRIHKRAIFSDVSAVAIPKLKFCYCESDLCNTKEREYEDGTGTSGLNESTVIISSWFTIIYVILIKVMVH